MRLTHGNAINLGVIRHVVVSVESPLCNTKGRTDRKLVHGVESIRTEDEVDMVHRRDDGGEIGRAPREV